MEEPQSNINEQIYLKRADQLEQIAQLFMRAKTGLVKKIEDVPNSPKTEERKEEIKNFSDDYNGVKLDEISCLLRHLISLFEEEEPFKPSFQPGEHNRHLFEFE